MRRSGRSTPSFFPPSRWAACRRRWPARSCTQKVREAERERQYEEFKDRVGDIINGTVKRVEYGNIIVDLGRGEGIVRRDQSIPREAFNIGDRIRTYIYDVRRENKGPQIMLSRAHGGFMAKLFAQEVPEVYDGVIEIRAVARDPGSRAKMAVMSNESSIDPVGACVGMRGSRVQAVVAELQGEKIDIIQWSPDEATFLVNALAPAEVSKVVMDEEEDRVEVVVPDEQLVAGHRPSRPERASGLATVRLADRHHHRGSGQRAPPARVHRAHRPVPGSPGRGRDGRPAPGHRRLRGGGGHRLRGRDGAGRDRGLRRRHRHRASDPRPRIPRQGRNRRAGRQAQGTGRRGRRPGHPRASLCP